MEYSKLQDRCRGSLVGGAVGDALGYEVEFMSLAAIRKRFGAHGITRYVTDSDGVALFSDDTQMSLFTLEGLMNGIIATEAGRPDAILPYVSRAYLAWYRTQMSAPAPLSDSWLSRLCTLWSRRAPGLTCMGALESLDHGHEVYNSSKGCGGVMRVAPVGIFSGAHPNLYSDADTARLAGEAAAITHKHPASTLASALCAMTVAACIGTDGHIGVQEFRQTVDGCLDRLRDVFPEYTDELPSLAALVCRALDLAESDMPQTDAIRHLGEGWVGDEALAIALFSVMRHIDSFEDCVVCAVNHDGDSDSTGAVAGNIIGAILGYSAIPEHYLDTLEIEPVLVSAADDLCADISIPEVNRRVGDRYVMHLPAGVDSRYLLGE